MKRAKACANAAAANPKASVPVERPSKKNKKGKFDVHGGPLMGCTIRLDPTSGCTTLPFTLHGRSGRYNHDVWEPST